VPENLRVGYISAESEPVPDALKMLGIHVEMLDANALNFGDLSKYDAIVVGVRAYELRSELPGANQRLLDYAQNGGTLVCNTSATLRGTGKTTHLIRRRLRTSRATRCRESRTEPLR